VAIPQGIAFSAIANVPPVNGLYTAWVSKTQVKTKSLSNLTIFEN
jgi:MFS superfamily sulfate permease-like transporter